MNVGSVSVSVLLPIIVLPMHCCSQGMTSQCHQHSNVSNFTYNPALVRHTWRVTYLRLRICRIHRQSANLCMASAVICEASADTLHESTDTSVRVASWTVWTCWRWLNGVVFTRFSVILSKWESSEAATTCALQIHLFFIPWTINELQVHLGFLWHVW